MITKSLDELKTKRTLNVNGQDYHYFSLKAAKDAGLKNIEKLPFSLKVLLENLLRNQNNVAVNTTDIMAMSKWLDNRSSQHEIAYHPARVLMQDFTGVPAVVDLAALRDAIVQMGGNPNQINPLSSVDLVIDHSVQVDDYASPTAFKHNVDKEMERNGERYKFLRWGQKAFKNFRVVPPGTGICHQVNLEYLADVVWSHDQDDGSYAYPDTLVGTDSHTTMVNGLGVLGWGVGGIEAEAAMLGQPISMLIPEVIGVKLSGKLNPGITATDLVLTIVEELRQRGVVGKFVEFFGPGMASLPLADRATIANMAPEYGSTCGFFPIDGETINYLKMSGRDEQTIDLIEAYAKAQGMWHDENTETEFTDIVEIDLSKVVASLAGPKRPQDRVSLPDLGTATQACIKDNKEITDCKVEDEAFVMNHGDVVIASITSCTNTSNPSVMIAAGLVARKAVELGISSKPWVKTSLAPGSKVVTEYFQKTGLQESLDKIGFNLVGYGCATCIGNSGPLHENITDTIVKNNLMVSAVLSGNRNFEGRVHPLTQANWLASPPLVVAYALAGTTNIDLSTDPVTQNADGKDIYLKDLWPSSQEIAKELSVINAHMFNQEYADVFSGDEHWQSIATTDSETYNWDNNSTYIQNPPFFEGMEATADPVVDVTGANILAVLGDSITTDHISPAGAIKADSPAGHYLTENGIDIKDFNSYGSRRGNHEVMMRGTFANIRIKNEMLDNVEGGFTKYIPSGETMPIYDAAMKYQAAKKPLVIFAGKEYGTGSSRDWAAKGTTLLGVKAVIAESYERIHRSNLIGMGVLPLQFEKGVTRKSLHIKGNETIDIKGLTGETLKPGMTVSISIHRQNGDVEVIKLLCRLDTENEVSYFENGGILQYVLRQLSEK